MAKKPAGKKVAVAKGAAPRAVSGKPSSLLDTRVVYCGDNLEPLTRVLDAFEDRHASTQAYIDYMRPRCVELNLIRGTQCSS